MNEVTLIIKTLDRYNCLKPLLKSIFKYYPNQKVLIADDSKKSCKEQIKKDFKGKDIQVFELPYDCGLSYGRNYLVNHVKTKYFCLLDDDFMFDEQTNLELALSIIKEKKLDILGGHIRNYKIRKNLFDRIIYLGELITKYTIPSNYIGEFILEDKILKCNYKVKEFPDYTKTDIVLNFFIAKTKTILEKNLWDEELKLQEHTAFFYKAKLNKLKIGYTNKFSVRHCPVQEKKYKKKRTRNYSQLFLQKYNLEKIEFSFDDEKKNNVVYKDNLKDILVSVIVPVYNTGDNIKILLDSLNSQMYKNLEIILVDNNSKDNTLEILKEYAKNDKRIKVYEEKKQGPNHARCTGFKHAKGDYLFFSDADDFLEDDAIYKMVKKISETDCDVVIGNYNELDKELNLTRTMQAAPNTSDNLKKYNILLYKPALWIKMFKKDLIDENMFTYTTIGEDMIISHSAIAKAKDVRFVDTIIYNYILTDNGLSNRVSLERLLEIHKTCDNLKMIFEQIGKYDEYKDEIAYLITCHVLYRAFRGLLLESKNERQTLREKTIKYLEKVDYKNNKYYQKSIAYRLTNMLVQTKWLYNLPIARWGVKLLFTNKLFNKIIKKLDK